MSVVNQQLEDNNDHELRGGTSLIDGIARVNASNEAEMERITRLYLEIMCPTIRVNSDDNNHGAGASTSSIDMLPRVSALTEEKRELVIRLCKEDLLPIICADINTKQQKVLSVIKEKAGLDLLKDTTWNSGLASYTSQPPVFQFKFLNGISMSVSTGTNIKGEDNKTFSVALVDQSSGQVVTTGAESSTKVEIVVLKGDCDDVEAENWSSDEFNSNIIREWEGTKNVLQGKTSVKLNEGIVSVSDISFTHNSSWKKKRKCRLGARCVDAVFATRVKEAISKSFLVEDKRICVTKKKLIPSLSDHVYRLNGISHRGACFQRLKEENIRTVMDLHTLNAINPMRLQDILKVHRNKWKSIMNHAHKCKDDKGMYLYPNSRDDPKRDGVVFNVSGHLVGVVSDSKFLPSNKLSGEKKVDGEKLVVTASEHWEDVKPFEDEASLINHLLSHTTHGLNLVIPRTNNHTSLITPIENQGKNKIIVGVLGATRTPTGQSSQTPKRPAPESEHTFLNSPKRPCRLDIDNDTESEDIMLYLNFSHSYWKTLWCVAGWISIFSKVRNPSTVTITNLESTC